MNLISKPQTLHWLHRLATPLVPDDYLELVNPLWSTRSINARVISTIRQTNEATTVRLQPSHRWSGFRAGQYVRVSLSVNGIRQTRCYSICSAAGEVNNCFDITVKAIADGRVSQHVNHGLKVGDVVEISEAEGVFTWGATMPDKALFISAGSGITPVMGMAREAARNGTMPNLVWLHYAPAASELIFADALAELQQAHPQLNLQIIYTRLDGEHFSAKTLSQRCPDWQDRSAWACGPGAMLDAAEALWGKAVAQPLITERFQAKTVTLGELTGGTLTFASNGHCTEVDGKTSILETAEAAGLSPKYGCRMGICHGCTVSLKAGQVRDLRTGKCFGEEGDLIQICVCAPAGDVEVAL
jgi:stearoyl-CoA 9-desaturase NADPH oxidoreductase